MERSSPQNVLKAAASERLIYETRKVGSRLQLESESAEARSGARHGFPDNSSFGLFRGDSQQRKLL
jgi:hypothetical protein